MGAISSVAHWPALWGLLGAFIYAGPRLIACLAGCREKGVPPWSCIAELAVSLAIGAIGAAAFSAVVLGLTHLKDVNAIAALIGMLANPVAPKITAAAPGLAASLMESPVAKALKGDGK